MLNYRVIKVKIKIKKRFKAWIYYQFLVVNHNNNNPKNKLMGVLKIAF